MSGVPTDETEYSMVPLKKKPSAHRWLNDTSASQRRSLRKWSRTWPNARNPVTPVLSIVTPPVHREIRVSWSTFQPDLKKPGSGVTLNNSCQELTLARSDSVNSWTIFLCCANAISTGLVRKKLFKGLPNSFMRSRPVIHWNYSLNERIRPR